MTESKSSVAMLGPVIVFGMAWAVAVPMTSGARIVLFDVFCVLLLLYRLEEVFASRYVRRAVYLFGLYSLLLLLSTYIHGLPFGNFVRRDYGAAMLLLEALAMYSLLNEGGYRRQLLVVGGLMLGICFHYFYPADARVWDEPIKFLVGVPLGVLLAVGVSCLPGVASGSKLVVAAVYAIYAAACVLNGDRSIAATFLLAALLAHLWLGWVGKRSYRVAYPWLVLGGLLCLYGVTELYAQLAIAGLFGERAAGIAEFQQQVFGNMLLGGRPEVVINLLATAESPLIGHGPLAQDPRYLEAFYLLGIYNEVDFLLEDEHALYHSMLFAAGHEAGVVAMIFWAYLLHRLAFAIPVIIGLGRKIAIVVLPIMIMACWHILFSPLNSYARWVIAAGLGLSFYWADRWQERVLRQGNENGEAVQVSGGWR